jgi:DNA repair exonuclease SbcCD ATPase subunit
MSQTLQHLKQNAGRKLKEILLYLATKIDITHNNQWSSEQLFKAIESNNNTDEQIKHLLTSKYQLKYIISQYNTYSVSELRKIVSTKINNKGWSKEQLVKYLVDNNITTTVEQLTPLQKQIKKLGRNNVRLLSKFYEIKQYKNGQNVSTVDLVKQIEQYMISNNITFHQIEEIINDLVKQKKQHKEKTIVSDKVQDIIKYVHPIQYVIHLADLHIPQKLRFEEYKQVFDNLINKINQPKLYGKTIVVICGDIFHTKVYQRSNSIILWNYLVKQITQLYPMFVITGNHDYDMTSNDNDWIASTYATDNFYHLNQCGEYVINNISIGVSPLNSDQVYKMEDSDKIRIQLYHGALKGCQMFNGSTLDEGILLEDFGNYDYLMLGDIHKMQFLSDNVAYSGSLVQQNFGELIDNHGFIIWDVKNKTKQFCEVHNDHAFLVVHISDEGYKFEQKIHDMNKSNITVRFDLHTNNMNAIEEFKQISSNNGWNIVKTKINKLYITSEIGKSIEPVRENLNILDYFRKKCESDKLQEGVIQRLCELHEEIDHSVNVVDHFVSQWKIKTINFKNLFCFGNNIENQLDLSTSGIYKLFANNFMGKSSMLKVVKWALYQDESGINDFDVLHKNSNIECGYVRVVFQPIHSNQEYVLERNITKDVKLKSTIRVEHKLLNGEEVLIGKENVNTKLCDIVGSYEEFELVASVNNTDLGILHKNASTVFNKLFNLGRFGDYEQIVKEMIQEMKNDIKLLQKEMEKITYQDEEVINELNEGINTLTSELESIQIVDLSVLIRKKQDIFNEYKQIELMKEEACEECVEELGEININKLKEMQQRKEELRSMIRNVKIMNEDIIMKNLNKYSTEIEILEVRIRDYHDGLEHMRRAINQYNQEMSNIKFTEVELYTLIKAQKLDYNKSKSIILEKLESGEICKSDYETIKFLITEHNYHDMMKELEQNKTITKKIKELENIIAENTTKMDEDMKRYNEITHKRYKLELMLKENNANKIILEKNIEFEREIENLTHDLSKMHEIEMRNKTILEKRKAFKAYQEALTHNEKYRDRKIRLESELAEYEDLLGNRVEENQKNMRKKMILEKNISKMVEEKMDIIENNNRLEEIKNKLFKKISNLELYNLYRGYVQEHGVPMMILHDKLPMIESDVNDVLCQYTNFKIVIELTGKRKSLEIYQIKNDEKISLGSLSGYETLITNIAFKVAIKKNCNLHCPNFIMIDEVLSSVSVENYDKLPELFELLESYYDIIFLITHIRDIKELCEGDGVDVKICREGGVSWLDHAALKLE